MIERIPITDRDSWLALRKRDVTASVVGALFGDHPYETALGLYVAKSGVDMPGPETSVLWRGQLYESAVAIAVGQQRPDWTIVKATEYLRDPEARIGATPDFWVDGDARGRGVLQAKTVAPREFRSWPEDQPPFWISLQTITEMMLSDAPWGVVAALVVDPYKPFVRLYEVPRHAGAEKRIREAVAKFWADIAEGREPNPDYGRDGDLIAALYPTEVPLKSIDLSGDNMLPALLAERAEAKARMRADEKRCDEIETEVRAKLGDAEMAVLPNWRVTWKTETKRFKPREASQWSGRVLRISERTAP